MFTTKIKVMFLTFFLHFFPKTPVNKFFFFFKKETENDYIFTAGNKCYK